MNHNGVFITATDTEVGKTVVSAALVLALRAKGLDAGYVKPIGTDAVESEGALVNPDAVLVKKLAGLADPVAGMNPVCLKAPLAPLAAARREGVEVPITEALEGTDRIMARRQVTVVEGVGGLLVPLAPGITVLDLITLLGIPVVLVARLGLGTINHTLLTLRALKGRGAEVLGVIYSSPAPELPADPSALDNPGIITEFSGAPSLGVLPWATAPGRTEPEAGELTRLALENLDMGPFLRLAE